MFSVRDATQISPHLPTTTLFLLPFYNILIILAECWVMAKIFFWWLSNEFFSIIILKSFEYLVDWYSPRHKNKSLLLWLMLTASWVYNYAHKYLYVNMIIWQNNNSIFSFMAFDFPIHIYLNIIVVPPMKFLPVKQDSK